MRLDSGSDKGIERLRMAIPLDQLIRTVRPCDVLMLNRGGESSFTTILETLSIAGSSRTDTKSTRTYEIADEVLTCIESLGGQFIRPVDNHGEVWVRCADSVVRTTVKQALRDMARQEDGAETPLLDTHSKRTASSGNSSAERKSSVSLQFSKSSIEVPTHLVIGSQSVASIVSGQQTQFQLKVDPRLGLPSDRRFETPMPCDLLQTASLYRHRLAPILPFPPVLPNPSMQEAAENSALLLHYLRQEQNHGLGRSDGLTEMEMVELMLELRGTRSMMNAAVRERYL